MAGRPSTKQTEVKTQEQTLDMAQMMKMMQEMQNQIKELSEKNAELEKITTKEDIIVNQSTTNVLSNIEPNEYINVMSLLDHTLNISTQGFGQGELYKFVEYGEIQPIIYSDLSRIISNQKTFLEKGLFVILDERVNKRHQLTRFSELVSKEMLDSIVSLEPKNVDELFKNLSDEQKDNVVEMIVQNAFKDKGENLDYSKLRKMNKYYKRDIIEFIDDSLELEKGEVEEEEKE